MFHSSHSILSNNFIKPVSPVPNVFPRETLFDPLHYSFDAETMIEPFTYFNNGPAESRRSKLLNDFAPSMPSPTTFGNFSSWSPVSSISPSEEKFPSYTTHSYNRTHHFKAPVASQTNSNGHPKTICRHCKSHNMPECLYTSHSMYDESGEIFCPVLKKCHCNNCIRVIHSSSSVRHDEDSDDDHQRYPSTEHDSQSYYGIYPKATSYRMNNNNF